MRPTTAPRPSDDDEVTQLRTRVRDLELALGQRDQGLVATFRLTPVLNNLMGLLMSVPAVTTEMIRQRMEIAPEAKVAMLRLRRHLDEWCEARDLPAIVIHNRRNVGYWIEDEDKARVRALVATKMRESGSDDDEIAAS